MKVQCGQCPAKYAVADERVRDKKVRIRCRRCNAAIVVDGKVSPPLVTSTPAHRSARPLSSIPAPESAPPSSPEPESLPSPRPVAHTIMGGLEAPMARELVVEHVAQRGSSALPDPEYVDLRQGEDEWFPLRPGMPEADRGFTEPPRGGGERWRVALTQQDLRWMTTQEITQAFRDGAVKLETFVFRAGMPTWVTLLEVGEIAQALADAELVSARLQAPRAARFEEENGSRPSEPPPRRLSSLPPPRRATRPRSAPDATAAEARATEDSASDTEESLPFALVSERSNGTKKSSDASAEPMAVLDASLRELAAREGAARDAAVRESAAEATPLARALPAAHAQGPAAAPAPVPSSVPSPLEPVPTASAAQPKGGGGVWIGLVVVLLIGAAVAFYFRFQLGLP
jgi:predicted Zn finger-like uncharacterized protein